MALPRDQWVLPAGVRGAFHRDDMADEQVKQGSQHAYLRKDLRPQKGQRVILQVVISRDPGWVLMYGEVLAINADGDLLAGVSMRGQNPPDLAGKWLAKLSFHREAYDAGPWIVEMLEPAPKGQP